jgi:hypothetical protein
LTKVVDSRRHVGGIAKRVVKSWIRLGNVRRSLPRLWCI